MTRKRGRCESEMAGLVRQSPVRALARGIDRLERLLSCPALDPAELVVLQAAIDVLDPDFGEAQISPGQEQSAAALRSVLLRCMEILGE